MGGKGKTEQLVNEDLINRYGQAIEDLNKLKKQNEELRGVLRRQETVKKPVLVPNVSDLYTYEHEIARRDLDNSIKELYYYLKDQFSRTNESFLEHATNQILFVLGKSSALGSVDNAREWRTASLSNIASQISNRINALQNPEDCSAAKKLICNLNKACGFGCQIHHVTYCFIVAYGTNRTLLLANDGQSWSYSRSGWESVFLPVSSCSYKKVIRSNRDTFTWNGYEGSMAYNAVLLPIIDSLRHRPHFLPLAFPENFAHDLIKYHSNPPVFFISQFMRYLMRPNENTKRKVELAASKIPFADGPIVGLQIRRTDKVGTEAAFHPLAEYMNWAEIWFRVEENRLGRKLARRVFVASDDPDVFGEARNSLQREFAGTVTYSHYEIFGDDSIAKSAQLKSRYSEQSLIGVIIDIELLARCSYLVCTFSSQVCRMGYELMQARVGDAGESFHSLDDLYYYGGQEAHEQVAVGSYKAETANEIDLEVGDVIGVAGNHWNGFSKGTNRRTGKSGLYPSYLVREKWITVKFP
ncbi:unnamed protein product [Enterobius vermicularis]|uniref:SH3 domain-containing protein n=1 Tax=Enterobius vermicularis TaxID=51028 RepID=A0A0N4UWN9_ENTVE|nr:unnamed protein product [Enterobius vermicularis]